MTLYSTIPEIGIVYKQPSGKTYTVWWRTVQSAWKCTVREWINDSIGFEEHLNKIGIIHDRMMCVVRVK